MPKEKYNQVSSYVSGNPTGYVYIFSPDSPDVNLLDDGPLNNQWWDNQCLPSTRTHICKKISPRFERFNVPGKAPDYEPTKT